MPTLSANKTSSEDSALERILDRYWYSKVELAPGVFTPGQNHQNVGITRRLLKRCQVDGSRCLDIGAMEGVLATRMVRMGGDVVAVDGADITAKVSAVKNAYGVEFLYLPCVGSMSLVERLTDRNVPLRYRLPAQGPPTQDHCFDVVVCSGVLYHVWSPVHVLGAIRSLMRPGALAVIETAFVHSREHRMSFNFQAQGYLYPHWSNTWFVTDSLLDHLLRLMHLKPIDCLHMSGADYANGVGRIAVVCRAVTEAMPDAAETQMVEMTGSLEFPRMLRLDLAKCGLMEDVPYQLGPWERVGRGATGSCDLYATVEAQPSCEVGAAEATLFLGDRD